MKTMEFNVQTPEQGLTLSFPINLGNVMVIMNRERVRIRSLKLN